MMLTVPLATRAQKLVNLAQASQAEAQPELPQVARDAAIAALARGETHYTDRPGILPLRQKVSEMLKNRYGLESDPNTVVITCGDTEARFVAAQCLLGAGDGLLCLDKASLFEGALIVRDAKLVEPEEGLEQVKTLYLTSDTDEVLRENYLKQASEKDWWIIFEVTNDTNFHPAQNAALKDKVVTIGGLGKTKGLESWRVGFLVAPQGEAPELRSFKQALTICTTSLSQYAALALMDGS